jgi:hypothetical protein
MTLFSDNTLNYTVTATWPRSVGGMLTYRRTPAFDTVGNNNNNNNNNIYLTAVGLSPGGSGF